MNRRCCWRPTFVRRRRRLASSRRRRGSCCYCSKGRRPQSQEPLARTLSSFDDELPRTDAEAVPGNDSCRSLSSLKYRGDGSKSRAESSQFLRTKGTHFAYRRNGVDDACLSRKLRTYVSSSFRVGAEKTEKLVHQAKLTGSRVVVYKGNERKETFFSVRVGQTEERVLFACCRHCGRETRCFFRHADG